MKPNIGKPIEELTKDFENMVAEYNLQETIRGKVVQLCYMYDQFNNPSVARTDEEHNFCQACIRWIRKKLTTYPADWHPTESGRIVPNDCT